MWAGSWAALLPPPSGPAITGLGAVWGHRPRCQGCSPLPIHPGAHHRGCLCCPRPPRHWQRLPASPSGLPRGAPCWDPVSVPSLPPGLRRRGQSQGVCVPPPPWHAKKGSSPGPHLVPRRGGRGVVTGKERLRVLQLLHEGDRLWGNHLAPSPGAKSSPELPARAGTCPPLPAHPLVCTLPGACSSPWGCAGRRCSLLARRPGSPRGRRCPTSASAPWT